MQLSNQQLAVVEAVAANTHDIMVVARAGCGKTTTILAACQVAKGRVGFFAFNKSIATELQTKAPPHVKVQTLHALGFSAVRSAFVRVRVDADKTYNLIRPLLTQADDASEVIPNVKKLVSLLKNNLIEPSDENLYDLAEEYNVLVNGDAPRVFDLVRKVFRASIPALGGSGDSGGSVETVIDFDDMIFLPSYLKLSTPRFDWTFVDEAQDMNAAQKQLVLMIAREGRVCFVGDPCQAIYHFRGADSDAMPNLAKQLRLLGRTVDELKLTRTRRCPKAIVSAAQMYVPDFEALPEAPQGTIRSAREIDAQPGEMVLCRKNAPLVGVAYKLLRANVPVKIQGKDIGAGLLFLIKKLRPTSINDLTTRLEEYRTNELAVLARRYAQKPSKLDDATAILNDKVETLSYLASEQTTLENLKLAIERLFAQVANSSDLVLLSTIHKAKGLEASRVWILTTEPRQGPQEDNIQYVAITRAKNDLVFVPAPDEKEA